jgi:hypothetical protein
MDVDLVGSVTTICNADVVDDVGFVVTTNDFAPKREFGMFGCHL